jgi:hypothetical protein
MTWYLSPNAILNAGFETGDFTNWSVVEENATDVDVSTSTVFSGDYSAKISGVNDQENSLKTDVFSVNNSHSYILRFFSRIDSSFVTELRSRIRHYTNADDNVSSQFATTQIHSESALKGWAQTEITLGPSGDTTDFTITGSTNGLAVEFYYPDTSSGNLSFIDDILMFQSLEVIPKWEYAPNINKIESDLRTKTGKLYKRKMAEWRNFTVPVEFFPSSKAALVNSWFKDNTKLLWVVTSSTVTQVFSVQITNNSRPFDKFDDTNIDQFKGVIELEEY